MVVFFFSTLSVLLVPGTGSTKGPCFVGLAATITADKPGFNGQALNLFITAGGLELTDMALVIFRIAT
jgi:hypothetical protein